LLGKLLGAAASAAAEIGFGWRFSFFTPSKACFMAMGLALGLGLGLGFPLRLGSIAGFAEARPEMELSFFAANASMAEAMELQCGGGFPARVS
jgi:hypothetical protein